MNNLEISLNGQKIEIPPGLTIPVNYSLENEENFQQKESFTAYDIEVPATPNNQQIIGPLNDLNAYLSLPDQFGDPMKATIESFSQEVLTGKAFLLSATHNSKPLSYKLSFYGNNADWKIDLNELTLWDILKDISFNFDTATIVQSWGFDGNDLQKPYVFAPVRYLEKMGVNDDDVSPEYLRPSISVYFILREGFRKAGYRMIGDFTETEYFRRLVMPWTWGNFLYSEGTRLDELKFLAAGNTEFSRSGISRSGFIDLDISNDSIAPGFDNSGTYQYDQGNLAGVWTYLPSLDYGPLQAGFYINVFLEASVNKNSDMHLWAYWYKNGNQVTETSLKKLNAPAIGRRDFIGAVEDWKQFDVVPGDTVSVKFYLRTFDSGLGRATVKCKVDSFTLQYTRIPFGGLIDFSGYAGFKKYKWIDFFRGLIDTFNLSVQSNPIERTVMIEPTHSYFTGSDPETRLPGFFNDDYLDWEEKQDVSKTSELSLVSDNEREFVINFKQDSNDGVFKKIQDRFQAKLGQATYVLPSRFKAGKKEFVNRFFSPLMCYDAEQWQSITGTAPQIPVIVPENISNTSRDEARNSFAPKLAYYKGNVSGFGGWRFNGEDAETFPFMFAVNYKPGGENDPVISYTDERIGTGTSAIASLGLLKRFYIQRMANIREGIRYSTFFYLNNNDVTRPFHREFISLGGQKWELLKISNYILGGSVAECILRKWVPVESHDFNSCFPTQEAVILGSSSKPFDTFYYPLKALASDIPSI
jgi:hypothetical protein